MKTEAITNPDKVYWPEEHYTKGDLLKYYQRVAPYMLPYLKDRPVMLHRYPEGIEGQDFYQKDSRSLHLPDWIETAEISHSHKDIRYLLIQDLSTLEYVINLGSIEIHPFNSSIQHLENPDYLVIDLDPEDLSFDQVVVIAQTVYKILTKLNITSCCKTSGKRGLHIYIPLNAKYDFEQAKQFGLIIAELVHSEIPLITSLERQPSKRQKKVYLDVFQNNEKQTVVCPYSVRGTPLATVSTPLKWSEVKKGLDPTKFTIKTMPARLKKVGDLFTPALGKGTNLSQKLAEIKKLIRNK